MARGSLLLFFLGVLISCMACSAGRKEALAGPAQAPSQEDLVRSMTYEEIQDVANYLLARIESGLGGKQQATIFSCDPSKERNQMWLSGPVRALLDAKRAPELAAYKKNPAAFTARIESCHFRCSCNAFALLLEDAGESMAAQKLLRLHRKNMKILAKESELETEAQRMACARGIKNFCESAVYRYLNSSY